MENSPLQYCTWLEFLRERIWSKIKYEEEMIPSDDALETLEEGMLGYKGMEAIHAQQHYISFS